MKTINQTLDEYASDRKKVIFKYRNWNELMEYINAESITIHIHNVMQEYATEAIKADRERVAEEVYMKHNGSHQCKQLILNLPIELP